MDTVLISVEITAAPDAPVLYSLDIGTPVPGAGVPEAPNDGIAYVRRNLAWESAAGAASGYLHTQAVPADTWTINHNLGYRPAVELLTVGGVAFDATVTHPTANQTIVNLLTERAGTARLT